MRYYMVKSKPNACGGYYLGIYKGRPADARAEFDEEIKVTNVSSSVDGAIAILSNHPDRAMWDIAHTIEASPYGLLDVYEMAAVFAYRARSEYASFARLSPSFDGTEDLDFREFVARHVLHGRRAEPKERDRIEWIARTIFGRSGAPLEKDNWWSQVLAA
jgi:hypothetical protein